MATQGLPDWVRLPEDKDDPALRTQLDVFRPGVVGKEVIEVGKSASTVFGRNPEMADVVLEHASISRRHAAVLHDGKGSLYIYDFGSTHGTYVDGQRVIAKDPVPLKEGSRVKFAESSRSYVFRMPSTADSGTAESKGGEQAAKGMLPPPPRSVPPPKTPADAGEGKGEDEAPVVLDKKTLQQLPMAFGGSKKPGAMSKEAMAAGIAEMMAEIQESQKKREKEEENGDAGGEEASSDDSDDDLGPRPAPGGEGEDPVEEAPLPPPPEDPATKHQIPMSHEVSLRGHHKSITCVAMDPAGSRVAVGGKDYKVLLYDFGGMDRTHKPFRELEPEDGNPVVAVSWSPSGDRFICATGSSTAKVFDRDGIPLLSFVKGDPYITDMSNTKGHTMALTAAQWHPSERDLVMTASYDGTLRLWDLEGQRNFENKLICKKVIKARSARSTKVPITCASFSPSGEYLAAGCADGSVQIFSMRKSAWMKPDILIRPAHAPDAELTAVVFAPDGRTLASRATDNSVKVWDIRKPQKPIKAISDVLTFFETANVAFSPDSKVVCCGVNIKKGEPTGCLRFYEVASASDEPLVQMGLAPDASVTVVLWHMRIKQMVVGTSAGGSKVLYDPTFSVKGALMSSSRVKRAKDPSDMLAGLSGVVGEIHNPHALPMFRSEPAAKRKREKERQDPLKSKKPEQPHNGPGAQGRISTLSNFTQFVMQNTERNTMRDVDPREAILAYADKVKEGTQLVGRAYKTTAPVTPFEQKTLEEEIDDMAKLEEKILKG